MQNTPQMRRLDTGLGVHDANFPLDGEGRTYHVGVKAGEVAARVVSVGDPSRAATLAGFFDKPDETLVLQTNRGFTTYTGTFRGIRVSVIATGMGMAMADFMLREIAAVTPGPMVVVRFGTCGTLDASLPVGSMCISTASICCRRNEDAWHEDSREPSYVISKYAVAGDKKLQKLLLKRIGSSLDAKHQLTTGLNCTADTFYATQGRVGVHFEDRNEDLIAKIKLMHSSVKTLEMETFQLFHLAQCSFEKRIRVSAACIVLANRVSNEFLSADDKHYLEKTAGRAILEAVTDVEF